METRAGQDHRIEPEYLGPLGDRPLAEMAGKSSPDDLFPGASKFLSARVQRKRREQWNAVRPMVKRLLQADEHVLHVAYAQQVPGLLDQVGFGHFVYAYHQVILVITDQRIIEALLNVRANGPGTRLRAYAYRHLKGLKQSFGKLTAIPAQGKKQGWRVRTGGDRKLVKLLLPRLQPKLAAEGTAHAQAAPLWHCPRCGGAIAPAADNCAACRTRFRSTKTASILSLAVPGGGLFYLGHPGLGTLSVLGESMLFVVGFAMMLSPDAGGLAGGIVIMAFLCTLVKLQALNVVRVLGKRSIPEPEGRRERAMKWAMAGSAASLLLLAGAVPLAASARPRLDHDLDAAAGGDWQGSRTRSEWRAYQQNTDARSQWIDGRSGAMLMVFGYPRGPLDETSEFRRGWVESMKGNTTRTILDDEKLPPPYRGFRHAGGIRAKSGEELALVSYFVDDAEAHDLHEVRIVVPI
ncbi:MAG TPA: hypothetical protein VFQ07_11115, partial [Candidatus Polarisedimenticolia bacterium]|nr:hypothetical protein [Candidatus Polarisedimenticolia bacterium]